MLAPVETFLHTRSAMSVVCRKCLVSGRVQGVYYRATVAKRARELGVTGYARNLSDGRVEVFACADAAPLEIFIESLWVGSSASRVSAVEVSDASPSGGAIPEGFRTL